MKNYSFIPFVIIFLFSLLGVGAAETRDIMRVDYQFLEKSGEKAKGVIKQLEDITMEDISFTNCTAHEAIGYFTKKVLGEKKGGVINFVIRGDDSLKKVGITSKKMTFAQAVDEICRQTERVWMIEVDQDTGVSVLVMKLKNG